jgi:hypothetical protein
MQLFPGTIAPRGVVAGVGAVSFRSKTVVFSSGVDVSHARDRFHIEDGLGIPSTAISCLPIIFDP